MMSVLITPNNCLSLPLISWLMGYFQEMVTPSGTAELANWMQCNAFYWYTFLLFQSYFIVDDNEGKRPKTSFWKKQMEQK